MRSASLGESGDAQGKRAATEESKPGHRRSWRTIACVVAGLTTLLGFEIVSAPVANAQVACSLRAGTRIVHPYSGSTYHYVLLEGRVFCSPGVATKVTELIRHEKTVLPDTNVASKQWQDEGTGQWQVYRLGVDCTASRRGQTFHGDVYLNYWVGFQGATLHVKTNSVEC